MNKGFRAIKRRLATGAAWCSKSLDFSDRDGAGRADLNAGLTAEALIFVYRNGFAFLHLKDAGGANVNAFFIAGAFICINFDTKSH
jgi:hypothetical protein